MSSVNEIHSGSEAHDWLYPRCPAPIPHTHLLGIVAGVDLEAVRHLHSPEFEEALTDELTGRYRRPPTTDDSNAPMVIGIVCMIIMLIVTIVILVSVISSLRPPNV